MSLSNPPAKKSPQGRTRKKPNTALTGQNTSQRTPKIKQEVITINPSKDLPPLLPTNGKNTTEKCPRTTAIQDLSTRVQPKEAIQKVVQSKNLSTKVTSMPTLQMMNRTPKTPEIKSTQVLNVSSAKNLSSSSPLYLQKLSSIPPLHINDKPSTSKAAPAKPHTPSHKVEKKETVQAKLQGKPSPTKKQIKKEETKKESPKIEIKDEKCRSNRKSRPKIERTYIADGLPEDCENLIVRCLQVFKLNFEKFCEIWKDMNFPSMYYGRQSGAEIAELSEEAIIIAKAHMVAKNVSFEENVAGLFLVYAFLNHQPYKGFAALRVVPGDVPRILHLEAEARRQRRHDVLYILGNVLIKGPCQYHVLPREVALEKPIRKYHDGSVQMSGSRIDSAFTKTADCVQHFKNAIAVDQRYAAIRQKVNERVTSAVDRVRHLSSQPAASLFDMYRDRVPGGATFERDLEATLKESRVPQPKQEDTRQDLVKSIKQRAMANAVDPMKHLTGVGERLNDNSFTSPESETEKAQKTPRYKGKGKGKGKGRSSAQTLHSLFTDDIPEAETPPAPSTKAMPVLNMSEDLMTVTYKPIQAPKKRATSLKSDDKPPDKRTKLETALSVVTKVTDEKTESRDNNSSVMKTNDESVQIPANNVGERTHSTLSESNINSDETGNTTKTILTLRNPIIKGIKLDSKSKSLRADVVKNSTDKSKTKDIKIKAIEIIKPADNINSKTALPNKEGANIELDSRPIEVLSEDKNIEVEIIDNLKMDDKIEPKRSNEAIVANSCKKDSNTEIKNAPKKSSRKKTPAPVFDVNKSMTVSTDQIDARSQRKNIRESRKVKNNYTVEIFHDLSSESDSSETDEKNNRDPNMPTAEEIEARVVQKERRDLKNPRIKSTFKKMGILEVADLKNDEDDS